MRLQVQSLASLIGLRIWYSCELWRRSQIRLGSCVAVAVAQALIRPLAWEPPHAMGVALEKIKQTNKQTKPLETMA